MKHLGQSLNGWFNNFCTADSKADKSKSVTLKNTVIVQSVTVDILAGDDQKADDDSDIDQ